MLYSIGLIGVWETVGFNVVLFLAGLKAIPGELYEATEIDGVKGSFDRFRYVTWPILGPTTMLVTSMTSIQCFKVFDTVAVLTQGRPLGASEVILYTIYREAFLYFRIGPASALSVLFLGIIFSLILLQARLFDRRVHYG